MKVYILKEKNKGIVKKTVYKSLEEARKVREGLKGDWIIIPAELELSLATIGLTPSMDEKEDLTIDDVEQIITNLEDCLDSLEEIEDLINEVISILNEKNGWELLNFDEECVEEYKKIASTLKDLYNKLDEELDYWYALEDAYYEAEDEEYELEYEPPEDE